MQNFKLIEGTIKSNVKANTNLTQSSPPPAPKPKTMSNTKQTAVEWLFQELDNYYQMKSKFKSKKEILKQAKEMEKQQIIEAYCQGDDNVCAEYYYNETYNTNHE
jgi:hypothetical protein